jgi:hypothetical protein
MANGVDSTSNGGGHGSTIKSSTKASIRGSIIGHYSDEIKLPF